ncbi:MAG: YjjG family noncanonical pyrimidine nucleotidase [Bacillota bacterium]|nr:YjjG family noncanonical pyrimidine nucleotidase [Bacillota bacterium]
MTKKYELILLDLDETVFDFSKAEEHSLKNALDRAGVYHDEKTREEYKKINASLWRLYEQGGITSEELRVERFRRYLDHFGLQGDAEKINVNYLNGLAECAFLIDGAEQFVKYLHSKYKVAVVTNGIRENQYSRVKKSPIASYIDAMVVSEEAGAPKPDARIFEEALRRARHTDKTTAIMIGDKLSSDILGGMNFGCDTIWYNPLKQENDTDIIPTYVVYNYEDIMRIL